MTTSVFTAISGHAARARSFFTTRDFLFHDGRRLREFSVAGRTQMALASVAAVTLLFSAYGVAQAAGGAIEATGIAGAAGSPEARMDRMRAQMLAMKADVTAMKVATTVHAARVEQRQALIAAVLSGKGDPDTLGAEIPAAAVGTDVAAAVIAPLKRVEQRQLVLAAQAQRNVDFRLAMTAKHLRRLGVSPGKFVQGGMGGPLEPVESAAPVGSTPAGSTDAAADAQFRTLFQTWKKLDTLEQTVIAIPSMQPVDNLRFTSSYGVRSDPFRGIAAMHAGVDIPGPIGTPIYATADGMVARAERSGGYGNLVEVNHGKGIETRYGHMSKILVQANTRVRRGQLIGLMGSTGRSTGSHLHYEVRIDGRAVNPLPYMQTADTMLAIQDQALKSRQIAMGGPAASR